jgi:hypothetical protein
MTARRRSPKRNDNGEAPKPTQLNLSLEPTLIDRFGHKHSAAVLQLWSPRLIEFMGLRALKATHDTPSRQ